jgi:hypothetical protein
MFQNDAYAALFADFANRKTQDVDRGLIHPVQAACAGCDVAGTRYSSQAKGDSCILTLI